MKNGDLVEVLDWRGDRLTRQVVASSEKLVFVCTKEEYENARTEQREPIAVGWPIEAVASSSKSK